MLYITFSDDNLDPRYAGMTFEMFPITWSEGRFIRTTFEDAPDWGIISPASGQLEPVYWAEEMGWLHTQRGAHRVSGP